MPRTSHGRPPTIALLPTLLTLGNGVCGFGSLTLAAHEMYSWGTDDRIFLASVLVFAAMVFDVLDGLVARLMNQTSQFGAQLDSLCDAVSFGLAPAFLVLKTTYFYHPRFLWVICVLYVVCALVRLARYNSEIGDDQPLGVFSGLPSPAAAGMIASFAVSAPSLTALAETSGSPTAQKIGHWLGVAADISLPIMTVTVALLMVSRIRYPHFNRWIRGRGQLHHLVQIVLGFFVVCAFHELAVPLIFMVFVAGSPLRAAWMRTVVPEGGEGGKSRRVQRRFAEWTRRRGIPPRRATVAWRSKSRETQLNSENEDRDGIPKSTFPRK